MFNPVSLGRPAAPSGQVFREKFQSQPTYKETLFGWINCVQMDAKVRLSTETALAQHLLHSVPYLQHMAPLRMTILYIICNTSKSLRMTVLHTICNSCRLSEWPFHTLYAALGSAPCDGSIHILQHWGASQKEGSACYLRHLTPLRITVLDTICNT